VYFGLTAAFGAPLGIGDEARSARPHPNATKAHAGTAESTPASAHPADAIQPGIQLDGDLADARTDSRAPRFGQITGEQAMADSNWEDALIHLHEMGWDTDDIDSACDALLEACREGIFEGNEPSDLDSDQLKQILGDDMNSSEQEAVVCLAEVRAQEDPEAEAMREALWDIDEFAESR
jgi:hypothetical protein